jgi:hypothetical protein
MENFNNEPIKEYMLSGVNKNSQKMIQEIENVLF